jgi:hypothetical protein
MYSVRINEKSIVHVYDKYLSGLKPMKVGGKYYKAAMVELKLPKLIKFKASYFTCCSRNDYLLFLQANIGVAKPQKV